jgi:hypothetical protein
MKYFLPLFLLLSLILIPRVADAASMVLQHAPQAIAGQEQFYVDVAVNADGDSFNGIEGGVVFSSNTLSFVRAETGASIVTYFIDQPSVQGNTVNFSGIIVGGFDGLINPFDQSKKFPGQIVRLVFAGKNPGAAVISTAHVHVTRNDGQGTLESAEDDRVSFAVSAATSPSVYKTDDSTAPTISASVVNEKDLYDGKATLIFSAADKQSGIDRVELQEGNGTWKAVESPYLLQDQSRKGILSLRAYDVAGNVATITIGATASHTTGAAIILIIITLILLYVIYKKSKHKKHVL